MRPAEAGAAGLASFASIWCPTRYEKQPLWPALSGLGPSRFVSEAGDTLSALAAAAGSTRSRTRKRETQPDASYPQLASSPFL